MSNQITITKKELQNIFDINGLDSYNVDSKGINHTKGGDVIVDERLVSYCAPFSCVVNHLY